MRKESVTVDQPRPRASLERATAERSQSEQPGKPSDTYPALGEPLAIEVANTLFTDSGQRFDALTTPAALTCWLQTNAERIAPPQPHRVSAHDLERVRELRAIIRALLAAAVDRATPATAAVSQLNELAASAPYTPRLQWSGGEPPKAHMSLSGARQVDALLALLAHSAIDVLGGSGAGCLRRCEAPGCINYYLKNHPRRSWCSPKCGNRVRVARHYERARSTRP